MIFTDIAISTFRLFVCPSFSCISVWGMDDTRNLLLPRHGCSGWLTWDAELFSLFEIDILGVSRGSGRVIDHICVVDNGILFDIRFHRRAALTRSILTIFLVCVVSSRKEHPSIQYSILLSHSAAAIHDVTQRVNYEQMSSP